MIYDYYDHKDIFDKNGEYLYTVSAHYKDRINYYGYLNRKLNEYEPIIGLSKRYCRSNNSISFYQYYHLPNISRYDNIDIKHNLISGNIVYEKISDYYYKG